MIEYSKVLTPLYSIFCYQHKITGKTIGLHFIYWKKSDNCDIRIIYKGIVFNSANIKSGLFHWNLNSWICIYYKGIEFYTRWQNKTRIVL